MENAKRSFDLYSFLKSYIKVAPLHLFFVAENLEKAIQIDIFFHVSYVGF